MKLIIIYGSEAVGKLTTAKELSKITKFPIFHNHLSIDLAKPFFEYGTDGFTNIVQKSRYLVFEEMSKSTLPGAIFTWAYSHPDFTPQLEIIKDIFSGNNNVINFVFLKCDSLQLEQRVLSPERSRLGKINSLELLQIQKKRKNHVEIPNTNSLVIDNTNLDPSNTAKLIAQHYSLPE